MERIKEYFDRITARRWLTIGLLVLLAFSLRAAKPFLVDRIAKDGVLYVYMADDIASGNLKTAFERNNRIPPLYLFLMAGLSRIGLETETAGVLISILAGAFLVIPVFLMAEMIFGARIATVAGFLAAFNPHLIAASSRVMRDSLFLFLLFFSLYLILKALDGLKWNFGYWTGAGALTLLASATRSEGVELTGVAFLAVAIEIVILSKSGKPVGKRVLKWIVGLLCMLLTYYVASLSLTVSLENTSSTWAPIDSRIPSFVKRMLRISEKDALKSEDTL